jgi:hypothetical protein
MEGEQAESIKERSKLALSHVEVKREEKRMNFMRGFYQNNSR